MGGGQSLNFGLGNLDTFAWVGGFSSAPNTLAPEKLVPKPEDAAKKLKLLWISCGDKDGLINISQRLHAYLKEKNVPHIWHLDSGAFVSGLEKRSLSVFATNLPLRTDRSVKQNHSLGMSEAGDDGAVRRMVGNSSTASLSEVGRIRPATRPAGRRLKMTEPTRNRVATRPLRRSGARPLSLLQN